jgi:hypothetical protein
MAIVVRSEKGLEKQIVPYGEVVELIIVWIDRSWELLGSYIVPDRAGQGGLPIEGNEINPSGP